VICQRRERGLAGSVFLMRATLVLSILVLLSSSVAAQPALTPLEATPAFDYRTPTKSDEYKDPTTATMLAIGGGAVGIGGIYLGYKMREGGDTPVMMLGGLVAVLGPSMGDWWASSSARITPGLGIRIAGAAIIGLGFARSVDSACVDNVCEAPLQNPHSDALLGIGAVTVLGGMIYDIATAGRTAERHNSSLRMSPQVVQSTSGAAPGFGVSGRF